MGRNQTCNVVFQRVTNNEIRHEDYMICLIDNELMNHSMVQSGHTHYQLETIETLKNIKFIQLQEMDQEEEWRCVHNIQIWT